MENEVNSNKFLLNLQEIHSYKEDLAPSGMDVVDSAAPTTPGFPVSPPTPYVNNRSPLTGKKPYKA